MDPIKIFMESGTAPVADALKASGVIQGLKPIYISEPVAGPAFTIKTRPGEWGTIAKALENAPSGSIIVAYSGEIPRAVWGGLMTMNAVKKGIKASIIYGYTRDTSTIRMLRFPLYSLGTTPVAGTPGTGGAVRVDITISGVTISPGDIIVMDQDGIIVVPKGIAEETARRVAEILRLEEEIEKRIKAGNSLYSSIKELGLLGKVG